MIGNVCFSYILEYLLISIGRQRNSRKPDVMSYLLSKLLTSIELLGTKTKTKERPNTITNFGIEHKPPFIINQTLFYTFSSLFMMIKLTIWKMCSRPNNHSLFTFCAASNKYIKWFCFPLLRLQWHMGTFPLNIYFSFVQKQII